jgi:hypothetical protein
MKAIAFTFAGLVESAVLAQSAPQTEAKPVFSSDWYRTLRQPGSHYPCCSIVDCRRMRQRFAADGETATPLG